MPAITNFVTMRFFISLILFLSFFATCFSQDKSTTSKFELGVIAGINISNVVGADVNNNSSRSGFHLGAYGEFSLNEKIGLRPEFHLISTKGTANGNFRTFYLDIPLLGTYQVAEKFKLLAGVQPSILYSARVSDGRGNITNFIRTLDLGVIIGGWYQISYEWGVGARFVPGLSRVGASGIERTFNSNFQLSVGYRFM